MVVGQDIIGMVQIAASGSLVLQPTGTDEWTIHNILCPTANTIDLAMSNGTNVVTIESSVGGWKWLVLKVNNAYPLVIQNPSTTTAVWVRYDGVQTL